MSLTKRRWTLKNTISSTYIFKMQQDLYTESPGYFSQEPGPNCAMRRIIARHLRISVDEALNGRLV